MASLSTAESLGVPLIFGTFVRAFCVQRGQQLNGTFTVDRIVSGNFPPGSALLPGMISVLPLLPMLTLVKVHELLQLSQ
jgi:hypothetical protein